jgi:hypothetical protein
VLRAAVPAPLNGLQSSRLDRLDEIVERDLGECLHGVVEGCDEHQVRAPADVLSGLNPSSGICTPKQMLGLCV